MRDNEKNVKVTEDEKVYNCSDILKAALQLKEDEREALFQFYTVPNVAEILNGNVYESCRYIIEHAEKLIKAAGAIRQIYKLLNTNIFVEKEFSSNYDGLSEDKRKKVVLELMNNFDFQRNCVEVMVKDYERIVQSNNTLSAIDNLLGIGKYFKDCVKTGIGCDHIYEV